MEKAMRVAYGETLVEIGKKNNKVVVFDADLANATQTKMFKKEFPDRFFDMGIAEQNLVGTAAGFAYSGFIPIVSTFAMFGTGRAFELIRNAVAYPNVNVKFVFTHAGVSVGEDGGSHQTVEDIAIMRAIPNMKVFVPCDANETKKIVEKIVEMDGPCYVRVARPVAPIITNEDDDIDLEKIDVMKDGSDVCLISCGLMVAKCLEAAEILEKSGLKVAVLNVHTIKPLDYLTILSYNNKCKFILTVEEHSTIGGLGAAVAEVLAGKTGAHFGMIGINDKFGRSGNPEALFEEYGLTVTNIIEKVKASVEVR